jgi:hypothetical protein
MRLSYDIKDKILEVGPNKTATTTLHSIFEANGLNSIHYPPFPLKRHVVDSHDCVLDFHGYEIRDIYAMAPKAQFIMNTRPLRKWLISRYLHGYYYSFVDLTYDKLPHYGGAGEALQSWAWPYSRDRTFHWILEWTNLWYSHLSFFRDHPGQLNVYDITVDGWVERFCSDFGFDKRPSKDENVIPKSKIPPAILESVTYTVDSVLKYTGIRGDLRIPKGASLVGVNTNVK